MLLNIAIAILILAGAVAWSGWKNYCNLDRRDQVIRMVGGGLVLLASLVWAYRLVVRH